jgi:hypothetical protein
MRVSYAAVSRTRGYRRLTSWFGPLPSNKIFRFFMWVDMLSLSPHRPPLRL